MKKILRFSCIVFLPLTFLAAQEPQSASTGDASAPVFRDPFNLKIHADKGGDYEQQFDKVPYVADNFVYLFAGEGFGINATVNQNEISQISYQKDAHKADVWFESKQERIGKIWATLLTIQNHLKQKLFVDALMTIPNQNGIYTTDVVPIPPNLADFESWPHPIVQLVLRNIRFSPTSSAPNIRPPYISLAEPKPLQP